LDSVSQFVCWRVIKPGKCGRTEVQLRESKLESPRRKECHPRPFSSGFEVAWYCAADRLFQAAGFVRVAGELAKSRSSSNDSNIYHAKPNGQIVQLLFALAEKDSCGKT
jgi:hypothetical protein